MAAFYNARMRIRKPYRILAAIAALFLFSACEAEQHPITTPVTIVALGDSLTAGYGLPADQAFPVQLQQRFAQDGSTGIRVINQGISGDTTRDGINRLSLALEARPDIVILELGANDILRKLPADKARANLSEIIAQLQQAGVTVLLTGISTPGVLSFINREIGGYDNLFVELGKDYGIVVYKDFLKGVRGKADLNLSDGIHPNAQGIAVIVENIYPTIRTLASDVAERKAQK